MDGGRTAVRPYKRLGGRRANRRSPLQACIHHKRGRVGTDCSIPHFARGTETRARRVHPLLPPSPSPMRWARGTAREPIWSAEASASASGGSFASALHNSPARPAGAEAVQVSGVLQRSFSVGGSFASALHNPPRGACPFTHMLGNSPPASKLLRRTVVPCIGRVHRAGEPHSTPRRLRISAFCADN